MIDVLKKVETNLDEIFNKAIPFQLPTSARKGLADAAWIVALVVGILQLWGSMTLWRAGERANDIINAGNYLSRLYGDGHMTESLGAFFYLSLLLMAAEGVVLLIAVPGLRAFNKAKGWDLVFYVALANVAMAAVRIFSDVNGGPAYFVWGLIGSLIGGYFLFQVRSYFNSVNHQGHKPTKDK